jgi:Domain of unknown function (DUF4387)
MRTESTLADVARVVKSANAGASWLTFDIECDDSDQLRRLIDSKGINAEEVGKRLGVNPGDVRIFVIDSLHSLKVTVPRRSPACGQEERDFDGVQQFVPLLDIRIP